MKKEYFISYVVDPSNGKGETAIVVRNYGDYTTSYYILNGDHRAEYAKCATYSECKRYYLKNKNHISEFSNLLY